MLGKFYRGLATNYVYTTSKYTELAKLMLNNYRANLITFWNSVSSLCSALSLDVAQLADIMQAEGRVNGEGCHFFGSPFGGRCLPKDLQQTIEFCRDSGVTGLLWESIQGYNSAVGGNKSCSEV